MLILLPPFLPSLLFWGEGPLSRGSGQLPVRPAATYCPSVGPSPGNARRVSGGPSAPRTASAELPEADPLPWGSDPEAGAHADRREANVGGAGRGRSE